METTVSPTIVIGEVSCSSNNVEHVINDPVAAHHKGHPISLRKQSLIRKRPTQKKKIVGKKKARFVEIQIYV